ncbi:unnamed protein product, partial [Soboliphyme baturini]|uniref:BRCT domain-containing protein n=1 Tax=Soboliphyme baturini TaxID=241478 RepID=A0A183J0W0_9BILA
CRSPAAQDIIPVATNGIYGRCEASDYQKQQSEDSDVSENEKLADIGNSRRRSFIDLSNKNLTRCRKYILDSSSDDDFSVGCSHGSITIKSVDRRKINSSTLKHTGTKKVQPVANHDLSIVLSCMSFRQKMFASEVVKTLGGFYFEKSVSTNTTHVICGDRNRTLKVLYGIARGCHILSFKWGQEVILKRSAIEKLKNDPPLRCLGPLFVNQDVSPPAEDIRELIKLCGGQIAVDEESAELSIGPNKFLERHISPLWLIDFIGRTSYGQGRVSAG